jgi:hypothetical protein
MYLCNKLSAVADLVQQAVYFIAEIVLKLTVVARFKLHRGLTVTYSEIGNKNIPLSVRLSKNPQHFVDNIP